MKKIVLVLSLMAMTTWGNGQTFHAFRAGLGSYSTEFNKWILEDSRAVDLTFTLSLQNSVMTVTDRKNSSYMLKEVLGKDTSRDRGIFTWNATDEDGRTCILDIMVFRESPVRIEIWLIYGNSCYYYIVTRTDK